MKLTARIDPAAYRMAERALRSFCQQAEVRTHVASAVARAVLEERTHGGLTRMAQLAKSRECRTATMTRAYAHMKPLLGRQAVDAAIQAAAKVLYDGKEPLR